MAVLETSTSKAAAGSCATRYKRHLEMTPEERRQMIYEAAYYQPLRHGFHGGADAEDWLEAEAEIDKLFRHG